MCAGSEPQWNEKGTILIPDVASDVLKIKVRNENWVGRYELDAFRECLWRKRLAMSFLTRCVCCVLALTVHAFGNYSNTIGKLMLSLKDLSRGRSMEKEFAMMPQGFIKVLLYLSIGHGNANCTQVFLIRPS